MHVIDDVLWEGEERETLTVQYLAIHEANEEVFPLGVVGGP